MDPPSVIYSDMDKNAGIALLLSLFLNCGLLGVLSVQVYLYYLAFPRDRVYMKCLVYGIYFLEVAQSVLLVDAAFRIFVINFQDVEGQVFNRIDTAWLSVPMITAIDTFFVQGIYAHRISILGKSKKVAGVIVALSFIQLGGGITVGIYAREKKFYTLIDIPPMLFSTGLWTVGSVLCDLIIAICMTHYLSRYYTTIERTKVVLKKIIRLTIETGSLTAVIGIVIFALAISPAPYYYCEVPMGIIGKIYANSMLVLNNSRMRLCSTGEEELSVVSEVEFKPPNTGNKSNIKEAHHGALSGGPDQTRKSSHMSIA